MSVKVEIWGPYACFTRAELKTERASFSVITPSAARGILESLYWHPGMMYIIDRIHVLSPIRFTNIRRNEVKDKVLASKLLASAKGGEIPCIATGESIQQRASMMLKDVHYVIEAHFDMTSKAGPGDNPGKFQDIIKRRLKRGSCYSQPYLGCRECTCYYRLWEEDSIPAIDESQDLGLMFYDNDYSNPKEIQPTYFHAVMKHGVIDLRNCEVIR